jgi:hypothetical protein
MRFLKGGPQLCLAKSWINVDTVPWRQFRRAKRTLAKTGRPLGKESGLQQLVTTIAATSSVGALSIKLPAISQFIFSTHLLGQGLF